MNLKKTWTSTARMNAERFERIKMGLNKEPYTVHYSSFSKIEDEPELYIMSAKMFDMMKAGLETAHRLTDTGSEYYLLKRENDRLRNQLSSSLGEIQKLGGEGYNISEDMWKSIKSSIFEAIEDGRRIFAPSKPAD